MQTVRELLLGSGETAKQVARRTGYRSDAAFNRAFASTTAARQGSGGTSTSKE